MDKRFSSIDKKLAKFDKKYGFCPRPEVPVRIGGKTSANEVIGTANEAFPNIESTLVGKELFPPLSRTPIPSLGTEEQPMKRCNLTEDKGKEPLRDLDGIICVVVKSYTDGDNGHRFWLEPTTQVGFIYREFAHYLDTATRNIMLKKDAIPVTLEATPTTAVLKNGDVLHVVALVSIFFCCNAFLSHSRHLIMDISVT